MYFRDIVAKNGLVLTTPENFLKISRKVTYTLNLNKEDAHSETLKKNL